MFEYIKNWFISSFAIDKLNTPQGIFQFIIMVINTIFVILMCYRAFYLFIGFFFRQKEFKDTSKRNRFAVIVPARNEELVIAHTLESIKKQDYPSEYVDIYVICDNCTDKTKDIALKYTEYVYERHEDRVAYQRKGYALDFLLIQMPNKEKYDAFIFFDADNILTPNFISEMNKAYSTGRFDAIQGYRSSKNFKANIFSSGQSFSNYRNILNNSRPRGILGTSTGVCGTGFMVSYELVKDGWKYYSIGEDWEFSLNTISQDYRIGYDEHAIFYDEQPESLVISVRQRIRWARCGIDNFFRCFHRFVWSLIKRPSWSKYDNLVDVIPYSLLEFILAIAQDILVIVLYCVGQDNGYTIQNLLSSKLTVWIFMYVTPFLTGVLILIKERKYIKCPIWLQIVYLIIWPLFDFFSLPIAFISLFFKMKWKKIPHKDQSTIDDFK